MLEKALYGSKAYWRWIIFLLVVIGAGFLAYLKQWDYGLGITGMSRDVSWGLYIAQFTYYVGVASSAVMIVIPLYLHNYEKFARVVLFGEFLAVAAVTMCMLFIFVDMGQPIRIMNVFLHPTFHSVMLYDSMVLSGYLILNITIGWKNLGDERKGLHHHPRWVMFLTYLSVPWAFSIHTVTAFLYAGLPDRHYWLSAIMAARFLAGAFASGPALLILLLFIVRKVSKFDAGREAIQSLGKVVGYAMFANVFFVLLELFTSFYSHIPDEAIAWKYLFAGVGGHNLVGIMWASTVLAVISLILLIPPRFRKNEGLLGLACATTYISLLMDKGIGFVLGGFMPNPLGQFTQYWPTLPEVMIVAGIYGVGALILTVLYKVAIAVKEEAEGLDYRQIVSVKAKHVEHIAH